MAGRLIVQPINPSLDANGLVASGSTVTVYQNGTTTLVSLYTAPDLLTPLANPLTCDSAGRFPQIWVAATMPYSVKWTIPGYSPITYDNIEALIYSGSQPSFSSGLKTNTIYELNTGYGVSIQGTARSTAAASGYAGEVQTATCLPASPVSLTTNTAANVTSLLLTPGHWLVWGKVDYGGNASTAPTKFRTAITSTTAGDGTDGTASRLTTSLASGLTPFATDSYGQIVGPVNLQLDVNTTYYLTARATFGSLTVNAYGQLTALRVAG